jgi:hypothetical protein
MGLFIPGLFFVIMGIQEGLFFLFIGIVLWAVIPLVWMAKRKSKE